MDRILLVDCMGLLYRGHFAMSRRPLTAPDGTVTSGLYHLLSELLAGAEEGFRPVAVLDYPGPTFRVDIYPEYKANRPPMPDELRSQVDLARRLLPMMGIPTVEQEGLEADDIIAAYVGQAGRMGEEVMVLSSDKDLLQLLGPGVSVRRPGRPGRPSRTVSEEDVPSVMGVPASKVADYLALVGDSSDNVPGAKGIGPKTAVSLLSRFDGIDDIYSDLSAVTPESVRRRLEASREDVMSSRELVRLLPPPEVERPLEGLSHGSVDVEGLRDLLGRLGMTSVLERVLGPVETPVDTGWCSHSLVGSAGELEELLERLGEGPVTLDTETTSTDPFSAEPVGLAVALSPERAAYVPLAGEDAPDPGEVAAVLSPVLADRGVVAQNAKYDLHVLCGIGVVPAPVAGDPMIADYLLRPEGAGHSLEALSEHWLGRPMRSYREVVGERDTLLEVPLEEVAEYCCCDAATAMALSRHLEAELAGDEDLIRVYRELELPLVGVLRSMESRGVGIDMEELDALEERFTRRMTELEEEAGELVGESVNLNSPAQVSEVLFDRLELPPVRKTRTGGFSSSYEVLKALQGRHRFVDLVMEHREVAKLLGTYVRRLPEFRSPSDGLVHTSFGQTVTATGRLSSSGPNLQNIPVRTARGREVRSCFRAGREGDLMVTADYSQVELRVLAHLAGPGNLREAYERDLDVHSATAAAVFGDDSPEHRRRAKEVNFSILYGISAWGLSRRQGVDMDEASAIIERYLAAYPELDFFFRRCVADAESTGETRTITGRRRDFSEMAGAKGSRRKGMERMAVNTTIQGSAADIIKMAMLKVHQRLAEEVPEAGLVLQVHDELVATSPPERADEVEEILRTEMEGAVELEVPLRVDTGVGGNWLEAQH